MPASADAAALRGLTVLVVLAHPDDESLACGGTLARLSDAGVRVVLLCASHGERGMSKDPQFFNSTADIRAAEARQAVGVLGISHLLLLDYPDGSLRWARVSELRADIVAAITSFNAAAVITFGQDGLYWHLDHIGIHERTTTAVASLGACAPALYYVTMRQGDMPALVEVAIARGWQPPAAGFWSLNPTAFGKAAVPPTIVVDVGPWVERKLSAICSHQSQMPTGHPFSEISADDAQRWLGREYFCRVDNQTSTRQVLELLA